MTIPESLEESAKIDGATEVTIFWKIVLPLSKATIALFTAVGYWNDYCLIHRVSQAGSATSPGIL